MAEELPERVSFPTETEEQRETLFAVERELMKRGLRFNTGFGFGKRDWWLPRKIEGKPNG